MLNLVVCKVTARLSKVKYVMYRRCQLLSLNSAGGRWLNSMKKWRNVTDRGTRSIRTRSVPVTLCQPQIPHWITWDWTRVSLDLHLKAETEKSGAVSMDLVRTDRVVPRHRTSVYRTYTQWLQKTFLMFVRQGRPCIRTKGTWMPNVYPARGSLTRDMSSVVP
jgi:hypothetical protein